VALLLVVGNGVILGISAVLQSRAPSTAPFPGVAKFAAVDDHLWRGAAPSEQGYRSLAAGGVRTVVDLRAEEDLTDVQPLLQSVGVTLVRIPIRDGQTPTQAQVEQFRSVIRNTHGVVFVHCGAGIGRTGVMAATYLVQERGASPHAALRENLRLGPPSLEQITYVASLESAERGRATPEAIERPNSLVVGTSRVLDAPRRLWSHYGF